MGGGAGVEMRVKLVVGWNNNGKFSSSSSNYQFDLFEINNNNNGKSSSSSSNCQSIRFPNVKNNNINNNTNGNSVSSRRQGEQQEQ